MRVKDSHFTRILDIACGAMQFEVMVALVQIRVLSRFSGRRVPILMPYLKTRMIYFSMMQTSVRRTSIIVGLVFSSAV